MSLYGQGEFLTGDPVQVVTFIEGVPTVALQDLAAKTRARRNADLPVIRSDMEQWVRECTRGSGAGRPSPTVSTLPGLPRPNRPGTGRDAYTPPQVGAKNHQTLAARLQYQARGEHLPYVRSAAYGQRVPANKWTRADLRAHDDPYSLTSGNGLTLNQDGLWTFLIKTDWSLGHAEVVAGAAQATRLMINGHDVGLRDYLDDDAYTAMAPINTFIWTDEFQAGTRINVDVRSEGLGANYTAVCNVYVRAVLMRCSDGEFDMVAFPLPPDPKPQPIPNPPITGQPPSVPSQPTQPQQPGDCGGIGYHPGVQVSGTGQVGMVQCVGGQVTTVWTSYGWDGGQHYGGGTTGANFGGPGPFPGQW
ncbi:hypothetical protein [Nonomuraea typhae]|uniref:Uncharacterized protein n=1 Tax=Nonomuraea typhae TaxID=2603600 RepID=A0ABW7YKR3_9ACTN